MLECSRKVRISLQWRGKLLWSGTMGSRLPASCASIENYSWLVWDYGVYWRRLRMTAMDSKLLLSSSSTVKLRQRPISPNWLPITNLRQRRFRRRDISLREVQLGSISSHLTSYCRLYCSLTCSTKRSISSMFLYVMAEMTILSKQFTRTLFLPIIIDSRFSSRSSPLVRGLHSSCRQMANTGFTPSPKHINFLSASNSANPLEVTTSTISTSLPLPCPAASTQLIGLFSSVCPRSTSNSSTISSSTRLLLYTILVPISSTQISLFLLFLSVYYILPTRLRFLRLLRSSLADEAVSLRIMECGYSWNVRS